MSLQTLNVLIEAIKNENQASGNTKVRVANALEALRDYVDQQENFTDEDKAALEALDIDQLWASIRFKNIHVIKNNN